MPYAPVILLCAQFVNCCKPHGSFIMSLHGSKDDFPLTAHFGAHETVAPD